MPIPITAAQCTDNDRNDAIAIALRGEVEAPESEGDVETSTR